MNDLQDELESQTALAAKMLSDDVFVRACEIALLAEEQHRVRLIIRRHQRRQRQRKAKAAPGGGP